MKESFGGTFMLWLFMFFFVIYITILCVALQFAKTYRVKNRVVNLVEQNKYNIYGDEGSLDSILEEYFKNVPYRVDSDYFNQKAGECKEDPENGVKKAHWVSNGGACIRTDANKGDSTIYYQVEVYFVIELPILFEGGIAIPIKGETTRIFINN